MTLEDSHGTEVITRGDRSVIAQHRYAIEVLNGPDAGRVLAQDGRRIRIGSAATNDLVLADTTVSAHHAEVSRRRDRWVLRDLGSTNGTFLGGTDVVEAYLETGSTFEVGSTKVAFRHDVEWVPLDTNLDGFGDLVGRSAVMRQVFGLLERVAPTDLICVVLGETGVGKEMVARAIHAASKRRDGPFVVIDCAAVNRTLIESDLFGHVRGAFTGAEASRRGAFDLATGGTLFLDEVGELPLDLQPRLLRVLERQEVKPLGADKHQPVDVRVVAATHRDLEARMAEGTFREDLFFRLAEIVLTIPPLSKRRDDLPLLAQALMPDRPLTDEALLHIANDVYPGNVRELRNLLRRAAALARGRAIDTSAIEEAKALGPTRTRVKMPVVQADGVPVGANLAIQAARAQWMNTLEPRYFEAVLAASDGDVDVAAAHAQLHRKTFLRTLRKHGLSTTDTDD